jgi:hypothetical protein
MNIIFGCAILSKLKKTQLVELVRTSLESLADPSAFNLQLECNADLREHVDSIRVCGDERSQSIVNGHGDSFNGVNDEVSMDEDNHASYNLLVMCVRL